MRRRFLALVSAMMFVAQMTLAHNGHEHTGGADVRIVGEVIDPVCYVSHDSRGPDHADCARMCVKQGVTLAVLQDHTGKIYLSLPVDHTSPNAKVADYLAKRVEVSGKVFHKGGVTGIFVQSVRELPQVH